MTMMLVPMKKIKHFTVAAIIFTTLFSLTLSAQEKATVIVKVKKEGKVVRDTSFQFEDASQVEHALKIMKALSGEGEHVVKVQKHKGEAHGSHSSNFVYVTKKGGKTTVKEMKGDSLVWISEEEFDGEHPHGKQVMVVTSDDDETFDIIMDEDEDEEIEIEIEKHLKEQGDAEEVEVIVIKKKKKKE